MVSSVEKTWKPFDFKDTDIDAFLDQLDIDKSVKVSSIKGGYSNALQRFNDFLTEGYSDYAQYRSDPSKRMQVVKCHLTFILGKFPLMKYLRD